MVSEKKPSIYSDRGTIGSADELDEYGVWVKSGPQDLSGDDAAAGLSLPDFDTGLGDISGSALSFADISGSDAAAIEPAETADFESIDLQIPDIDLSEAAIGDAAGDELNISFDAGSGLAEDGSQKRQEQSNLSTQLLMKIADELASIRTELTGLKKEFAGIRVEAAGDDKTDAQQHGGFFSEEEDEKIALTGDEMNNILSAAEFTGEEDEAGEAEDGLSIAETAEMDVPIDFIEEDEEDTAEAEGAEEDEEEIEIDFQGLGIDLSIDPADLVQPGEAEAAPEETPEPSLADMAMDLAAKDFPVDSSADDFAAGGLGLLPEENLLVEDDLIVEDALMDESPAAEESLLDKNFLAESSAEETFSEENLLMETPAGENLAEDDLLMEGPAGESFSEENLLMETPPEENLAEDELLMEGPAGESFSEENLLMETPPEENLAEDDLLMEGPSLESFSEENLLMETPAEENLGEDDLLMEGPSLESFSEENLLMESQESAPEDNSIIEMDEISLIENDFVDSEEIQQLRDEGAEPMTPAPDDSSYLEEDLLSGESDAGISIDEEADFDAASIDLSEAVIDEPDLSTGITENPVEEPSLNSISLDGIEDINIELDDEQFEPLAEDAAGEPELPVPGESEEDTLELNLDDDNSIAQVIPEGFEQEVAENPVPFDDDLEGDFAEAGLDTLDVSAESAEPGIAEDTGVAARGEALIQESAAGDSLDIPTGLKNELKTVLSYMDQLLESLPEEKIEEFAKSEYFDTYKKLFKELGLV